ncbi:MAG: recombination protein RecR [Verrucomicrobia bacterium]|nr:recombination protein RecR [Verrucomicrobiota bacterium]
MRYPLYLSRLMEALKALPGVGSKTADRYVFEMLHWPSKQLQQLAQAIDALPTMVQFCSICGCLNDDNQCLYCNAQYRDSSTLCVVASVKEVFAIEATGEYRGFYHVLGGLLSPLEGKGPEQLRIASLKERLATVEEAIIALDSTVEGDATSLFLKQQLERQGVKVSRLAFGLPLGSPLDYVDGGTLSRAMQGRRAF